MKAIILARVSTEEQKRDGKSLPAQLIKSRDYATEKKLSVYKEFQFDESSTKDRRKKFDQVIKEIKQTKEKIALIVDCVDRLQRGFRESVLLDDLIKQDKTEIHFIREGLIIHKDSNSAELQRWDMAVMFARSYVLQISDNVKRTFAQKHKDGTVIGKAPIGYQHIHNEEGKLIDVVPDPTRAPFISKIFELYATGNYSMERIADRMKKEGLRSNRKISKSLKTRQIEHILKNHFYYGLQSYNEVLKPHQYKPLISYQLFLTCQNIREGRWKNRVKKHSKYNFIFQGLIRCKRCGCAITPEYHKKNAYYHCTDYKKICKKVWLNEKVLLKKIQAILKKLSLPEKRIKEITRQLKDIEESKQSYHIVQTKSLQNEYNKLDEKISLAYEDRLDSSITKEQYNQFFKKFKERQEEILALLSQHQKANTSFYSTVNQLLSVMSRANEIFESSEPEEKKQILNFVFQNLELDGKKLVYKLKTPLSTVLKVQTSPIKGD